MIFLFDNCYLSTTNQIVENSKHIWVGNHKKKTNNGIGLELGSFDVYKVIETIDDPDQLFLDIHENLRGQKTIIYCDSQHFQKLYSYFFKGILSETGVSKLYQYDKKKENYGIGSKLHGINVTGYRDVVKVNLPERLKQAEGYSTFASTLSEVRIEIALANCFLGDADMKQYCIERIDKMYDGSPGVWESYIEQTLPALLIDQDYTIENLSNPDFIKNITSRFKSETVIPSVELLRTIKEVFGYDYYEHFVKIINDNTSLNEEEYMEMWRDATSSDKKYYIENYLINPTMAETFQLIFPNISHFDSINPIFWNDIIKNHSSKSWLNNFKVTNGTNYKTNGTV